MSLLQLFGVEIQRQPPAWDPSQPLKQIAFECEPALSSAGDEPQEEVLAAASSDKRHSPAWREREPDSERLTDVKPLVALLVLFFAASTGGSPRSLPQSAAVHMGAAGRRPTLPASSRSEAPLSARIVLPATTMRAGSSMTGHVVVDNNTGHALHATGCISLFAVALGNDEIAPRVAWALCLQRFTIPSGSSRYPVTVTARDLSCPPCSNGLPRPLPPGDYRAMLFQASPVVPTPPAVGVRVTP